MENKIIFFSQGDRVRTKDSLIKGVVKELFFLNNNPCCLVELDKGIWVSPDDNQLKKFYVRFVPCLHENLDLDLEF